MLYYLFCKADNEHVRYFEKSVLEYHIFLKWGPCVEKGKLERVIFLRAVGIVNGPARLSRMCLLWGARPDSRALSFTTTFWGNPNTDCFTFKLPGLRDTMAVFSCWTWRPTTWPRVWRQPRPETLPSFLVSEPAQSTRSEYRKSLFALGLFFSFFQCSKELFPGQALSHLLMSPIYTAPTCPLTLPFQLNRLLRKEGLWCIWKLNLLLSFGRSRV